MGTPEDPDPVGTPAVCDPEGVTEPAAVPPAEPDAPVPTRIVIVRVATGTDVGSSAHFQAGGVWWELEAWRRDFPAGRRSISVEQSEFRLADYRAFLAANADSITALTSSRSMRASHRGDSQVLPASKLP